MTLAQKTKLNKSSPLNLASLELILGNLQTQIELFRGDPSLKNIYFFLQQKLKNIGFCSLISVCDKQKNFISIKDFSATDEYKETIAKIAERYFTKNSFSISDVKHYQSSLKNGEGIFCSHPLKSHNVDRLQTNLDIKKYRDLKSAVLPLVIKGETIGFLEILSPQIDPSYLKILNNFTTDLTKNIANLIFYNEINKSEKKYLNLFENAKEGFIIFDTRLNRIIMTNQEVSNMTGYTQDELKQINFIKLFASNKKRVKDFFADIHKNKGEKLSKKTVFKILAKNHKIKYVKFSINKMPNSFEWLFMLSDISDIKITENELRKSKEKYKNLVENAREGVFMLNLRGYFYFANKAFLDMTGYSENELKKTHFSKLLHPDDRVRVSEQFQRRIKGEKVEPSYEFKIIDKEGKVKHVNYSGIPTIMEHQKKIIGIQAIIKDITENKKLQERIEYNKNHYEQLIDSIEDCICVVNKEYKIISANKSFAKNVEIPIKKIKDKDFRDVILKFKSNFLKTPLCYIENGKNCIIDKVLEEKKSRNEEVRCKNINNASCFYKISAFPFIEKNQSIKSVIFYIRDISEQKYFEEKIRWLNNFNKRILDTAPISIVVLDGKGTINAANSIAKRLMEENENSIIGSRLCETKEISKNKELLILYDYLLNYGKSFYYQDLPYKVKKTREKKHLNIIAVPLLDKKRQVEGAISMALDNTEAVLAKQKLENFNKELEKKVFQRTRELDIINKKLNEALSLKSKFIADSSHELRTPLTIVQGNIDVAINERKSTNKKIPEIYALIDREAKQMTNILTDLTMLTNADVNAESFSHEKLDLKLILETIKRAIKVLTKKKGIYLKSKKIPEGLYIMGDESKIEKLFLNIARNAIKYTENGGWLKIWASAEKHGVEIYFEDSGIGIPEKDLPFIFERFYRVDKSRSRSEGGTGLGLSIAKWIAETHGGQINVESKLGEGSKFTVYLPYDYKKEKNTLL